MFYKVLSDVVVLVHFLWIVFLFFGAFLGVRSKPVKIMHISGLVFAIVIQVFDWYCPLTHLEVWLRSEYDPALAYKGSFIIHYIEKIVYIELSRHLVFIFSVLLCIFNGWFYHRKR